MSHTLHWYIGELWSPRSEGSTTRRQGRQKMLDFVLVSFAVGRFKGCGEVPWSYGGLARVLSFGHR